MDQISRPMRIALAVVVLFAAAWMTVLKPKAAGGEETAAVAPVPATPVDQAQGAVATANGAAADAAAAAAGDPAATAPPTGTPPAAATPPQQAKPKRAPSGATTVLLFAGSGADDKVARGVVRSVRGPGVKVIVASLGDVAKYQDLLGALEIEASPTILVIGADRSAQRIEGLPDAAQVRQAVRAAR